MVSKGILKKKLRKITKCSIQHDGWTCGTCFFAIDSEFTNADWQSLLFFRGDYRKEDLDNLPKDYMKNIDKIDKACSKKLGE